MKKRKILSISLFVFYLILPLHLYSQQEASFNMYMFNNQMFNSGYVGSKNYSTITFLNRSQWVGFSGAPSTQSFSYASSRGNKNLAIAVSGLLDQIGPIQVTNLSTDISYQLKINDKENYLGVGIKLSSSFFEFNSGILTPQQQNDSALFSFSTPNTLEPNVGFGLYYHTPKFYLGYSIPRMIENDDYFFVRHNYLIMGGLINLSKSFDLKPSLLLKTSSGSPVAYDFSTLIYLNKTFWIGPQIKNLMSISEKISESGSGLGFIAGLHLGRHFSLGYVLGSSIGISNFDNLNSHEILLRYDFSVKKSGILLSPRIF
ncbi:MAG: PorP/SprF family type IX secretion system membrane protein [Flavobacteriaceae bacterium]|nr:PorP/SprF family type IX secretion system membrane protein [Flavobacteriaceae bacterium]